MARPLSPEARAKILGGAGDVILELGVGGFTVDEVARRSGVAKTTIYRHFGTSSRLIVDAFDSIVAPFPTPNTGSLRGDLHAYCEITSQITADPRLRVLLLELLAAAAHNLELAKTKQAMLRERTGPVRTMIQLAMARGEVPPHLDPDFAVQLAEAPFLSALMFNPVEAPTEAELHLMIDFVVAGLTGMSSVRESAEKDVGPGDATEG